MRVLTLIAGAALTAAPLAAPVAAQFPTQPPAPMALEPAQFPPFAETILENGLRIIVVSSNKQPVLSLTLAMPGGSFYDPAGKVGLADMVAGLLTKGAGTRTADEMAAAIEGVGGSLSASAGADFLTLNAAVLSGDRQLAFDLLADAALRPTFPETELELLRKQTLSALALEKAQPAAIAARAFSKGIYGDQPYGRSADEASVGAITRADLVGFHAARVRPNQALLVIAGAIDTLEARQLATAAFGAWSGVAAGVPATRPAPQRMTSEILLVHKPGAVQSNIVAGNTTWTATDSRGYALTLANQVLGGASDSRLFQILREQKGWTYGAYSGAARRRVLGYFQATAEVRTEVTDSALVELLHQMRRLSAEPMPPEEFDRQKQTLVGRFPLEIETAQQVASQVASARLLGLATDYVQTYRQRLAAVTPDQARAAARMGIRADASFIVVVGDATKLTARLQKIAPVTVVDVDGKPLATADLEVKGGALDLDRARMMATADSFAVMVQGQPFGYQVASLAREGEGWVYRERSQLATIIQQQTEVRFGADLAMQATTQSGRFQGQEMKLDVHYAAGTASGEGITPGAQGMQPVKYEKVVTPEGTVDDNLVQGLLPYFKWTPTASFTINVFASGKGSVEPRTYKVSGEEELTLPIGTVKTWRVLATGGEQPGTYWIEVAAPHRVMKFGPANAPVEFVRAK